MSKKKKTPVTKYNNNPNLAWIDFFSGSDEVERFLQALGKELGVLMLTIAEKKHNR